jgi:hypothetical protein
MITGELVEFKAGSYEEVVEAWMQASELERLGKAIKDQLKALVPLHVSDKGTSEPYMGRMFRLSAIQRMNYDKSVLRQVLDADTFDLLLKPDKPLVDKYIKDNVEALGDKSVELRKTMLPEGKPYQVIKLEKLV